MAMIKHPPKPKGDMASLAVFMENPKKFKEIVDAIAHYEEILGANAQMETAKATRADAEADRALAAQALKEARAEAAKTRSVARDAALKQHDEAKAALAKAEAQARETERAAQASGKDIAKRMAEADAREKAVEIREVAALAAEKRNAERHAELKAITESMRSMLR